MQRRSSPRIKVKEIYTKIKKGRLFAGRRKTLARIIDLGPKGMSIEVSEMVPTKKKLIFLIDMPHKHQIKCEGVIKNSRETEKGYILGIEFTKLSKEEKEYLKNSGNILEVAGIDTLETAAELSDRIRFLRSILRMTTTELAEASGVDSTIVSQLEGGQLDDPPEEILEKLAKTLGSTTDILKSRTLFLSLFKENR